MLTRSIAGWLAAAGLALVLAEARAPQRPWYLLAAALAAVLIISLLAAGERRAMPHGRLRRAVAGAGRPLMAALSSRPLRFTGRISYGIYLYHLPIYYLLLNYLPGRSPYFYGPLVLAASLLAAVLSWKLLELPIIRHDGRGWDVAARALHRCVPVCSPALTSLRRHPRSAQG